MTAISSLIAARRRGDPRSLQALAVALASTLRDTPAVGVDPVGVLEAGETQGAETPGTWQEVRAAADYGELSRPEYDYLAATVAALTMEDT